MKLIVISMLLSFSLLPALAQSQDLHKKEVMDIVFTLFEGMRQADTTLIKSVFMEDALLHTATSDAQGNSKLVTQQFKQFLIAISKAQPDMLNEPLWDYDVQIDNNFASVWTKYAFYYGKSFSHCGVDAFHLLQTNEGWKIFHLVDTRQKEGCDVPTDIRSKFEKNE
jgi:hypothetical protein